MNFLEALLLLFPLYPKEVQDQILRSVKRFLKLILFLLILLYIFFRLAYEYDRTHPKPPSHAITAIEAAHEYDRLNGYIH